MKRAQPFGRALLLAGCHENRCERAIYFAGKTSTTPTSIPCPPVVWWQWIAKNFLPGLSVPASGVRVRSLLYTLRAWQPAGRRYRFPHPHRGRQSVQVLIVAFRDRHFAAYPDVVTGPVRIDLNARRAVAAEAALTFLPGGIVEISLKPVRRRLIRRIAP